MCNLELNIEDVTSETRLTSRLTWRRSPARDTSERRRRSDLETLLTSVHLSLVRLEFKDKKAAQLQVFIEMWRQDGGNMKINENTPGSGQRWWKSTRPASVCGNKWKWIKMFSLCLKQKLHVFSGLRFQDSAPPPEQHLHLHNPPSNPQLKPASLFRIHGDNVRLSRRLSVTSDLWLFPGAGSSLLWTNTSLQRRCEAD